MSASSSTLHEPAAELSEHTQNMHRALVSLQEELEAVDWYRQRADACGDQALREVLLHNMREEIEHAAMVLEWLRRNDDGFDEHLRTYLFTDVPILAAEEAATAPSGGSDDEASDSGAAPEAPTVHAPAPPGLTLGSLKPTGR
jgi:hypothetical protein